MGGRQNPGRWTRRQRPVPSPGQISRCAGR
jgi:hypothetical protein